MSEGDTELRDLVSNTLENSGVLAKIRAELRASVFLVLEEHEAFKGRNISFTNKPLKDFLGTQEGIIAVSLIREFLEYFGLEFTASVFEPETQAGRDYEYVGRSKLAHDLKLNPGKKAPLIAQVLQESKICFPNIVPTVKDNSTDAGFRRDKVKEEKKEALNTTALKADVHTNGFIKPVESPGKDGTSVDSKEPRPLLANSPPNFHNHLKKPDSLKLDLSQMSGKSNASALSSLGSLPPLGPPPTNSTSRASGNKTTKQVSSEIKALLDLGSGSPENNYEEDFHASGSEKTSKGTNRSLSGSGSEVEEDMSVGMDDHISDNGSSNGSKNSGES